MDVLSLDCHRSSSLALEIISSHSIAERGMRTAELKSGIRRFRLQTINPFSATMAPLPMSAVLHSSVRVPAHDERNGESDTHDVSDNRGDRGRKREWRLVIGPADKMVRNA
jgi:hypothetical protein